MTVLNQYYIASDQFYYISVILWNNHQMDRFGDPGHLLAVKSRLGALNLSKQ